MPRRDLSDAEWAILAPFFPPTPPRRGGRWKDPRTTPGGVSHRLRPGCPWRDLPGRYGPWRTVYERFNALRRSGRLGDILSALQLRLSAAGPIDHSLYLADGTSVRASRPVSRPTTPWAAAGAGAGPRSTSSPTPTACRWPCYSPAASGRSVPNCPRPWTPSACPAGGAGPRRRPDAVAGARGYSHPHVRAWPRRHGIRAVIPYRKDQNPDDGRHRFDRVAYRRRAGVEQCAGRLKESRAVGTRSDELAVNYLATVQLAVIRRYLRVLIAHPDSADRP